MKSELCFKSFKLLESTYLGSITERGKKVALPKWLSFKNRIAFLALISSSVIIKFLDEKIAVS